MTEENIESDNVIDFVEYKMLRLIDELAKVQRLDIADVLSDALDKYLAGEIGLTFVAGWPYVIDMPLSDTEWLNILAILC